MKNNIISKVIYGTTFLALASCSTNSWNDKLDGFEGDKEPTDVQAIQYTLTDADYATLAANSTNKALAGADNQNALKAVGTKHCFDEIISAKDYIPALLSDPNFTYFTLSNGSALKLTYNVAVNASPVIAAVENASTYEVSESDYENLVWKSETDYVNSFAPSKPASSYLSNILKENISDPQEGDYVIANYNTSAQEPVFGTTTPSKPSFELSNVISGVTTDAVVDIKGVVTGVCTMGYIITDNSGSLFVYYGKTFDATSVALGDQLAISGTVGAYNKGYQLTGTTVTMEKIGTQAYTYPNATILDGAALDATVGRTDNEIAKYVQMTGTVTVSGYNININVDGAATAKGSAYGATDEEKALLTDGAKVTVSGYFVAVAAGRYVNMVITKVTPVASIAAAKNKRIKNVVIPTSKANAVYSYTGGNWKAVANTVALGSADYEAMGNKFGSLSAPDSYLPIFLKTKYPYAQEGASKFVVYKLYANSTTTTACDEYTFNGSAWVKNNGVEQETAQFVKNNGKWMFDPNVTLNLVKGSEIASSFYQGCTNWVYENIDKPLGSTSIKGGLFYVSKYGNNEYYCGTSAYYANVDIRASKAKDQYTEGYEGMSDEEIMDLMKLRFCTEVAPGTLATLYPDVAPIDGLETLYTVKFVAYHEDATSTDEVAVFKVIGKGKFQPVSCTWYADGNIPAKK